MVSIHKEFLIRSFIVHKILQETFIMYSENIDTGSKKIIRKHWNGAAVFTDAWHPGINEQEYTEAELLPGELSAVIFTVGCYIGRSAKRVYRIPEPSCGQGMTTPADEEETELVKKDTGYEDAHRKILMYPTWRDKLEVVQEISARHKASPNSIFTIVCSVAQSTSPNWSEFVRTICTAKEHDLIPDEYASLLVCSHDVGSSFGADTWYKLDPTGKITTLSLHPFDSDRDDARFV